MNDFLSNFEDERYKELVREKRPDVEADRKESEHIEAAEHVENEKHVDTDAYEEIDEHAEIDGHAEIGKHVYEDIPEDTHVRANERKAQLEETEKDPGYKKRQRKKLIIVISSVLAVLIIAGFTYYKFNFVKMPDFKGGSLSEASLWMSDNKMSMAKEEDYSFEHDAGNVIGQSVAEGKTVKKKSRIIITVSKGANPDDVIPLPDFSEMTKTKAEEWAEENKAENLNIMSEYSDTVENGKFIRQEISDKEITAETYRRKDRAIVYYSKGAEVFEKDIAVPDFTGKAKSEVESWASTNEIKMTYEETPSDTIEAGMVVSQSIAKGEKVAKRDSMTAKISLGKALVVPDFATFNYDTAAGAAEGLNVQVKEVFSGTVEFGGLISQSIAKGTQLTEKDSKNIEVVYSCGAPYLRSYIGELEGDLPKAFYDDYKSKGANINYAAYYIDSSEEKGRVVEMSVYNQYVSMTYTVSIGISRGNLEASNDAEAE